MIRFTSVRMSPSLSLPSLLAVGALLLSPSIARAQAPTPMGAEAPPPDAKALVTGPGKPKDAPTIAKPSLDETNASLSSGGLITTGNSKTVALSFNGLFDLRRGNNGFLTGMVANYGESSPPGGVSATSVQNIQGKLRYDRYFVDSLSGFFLATGRHDRFQGLSFRLNMDPGVKFIPFQDDVQKIWLEAGYDFQFDARNAFGKGTETVDGKAAPEGTPRLDATRTDHSARAYLGYRRAFNQSVTASTGVELLQSFVKTDLGNADTRINFDVNLAAKLDFGFSLGVGFSARYDRLPIAGKEKVDTSTTLSLIYAWTDAAPKKAEKPPCPDCPACPPPAAPPPAAAPVASPPVASPPVASPPAAPPTTSTPRSP